LASISERNGTSGRRPAAYAFDLSETQARLRVLAENFARSLDAEAAVAATLDGDGSSVMGTEPAGPRGNGSEPGAPSVPAELIREAITAGGVAHGPIPGDAPDAETRFAIVVPVRVGRLTGGVLWAAFPEPPPMLDRALGRAAGFGAVMASCLREAAAEAPREAAPRDEGSGCMSRSDILRALSGEVARCERHERPLSVCLIDLDGFVPAGGVGGRGARNGPTLADVGRGFDARLRPYDAVGRVGGATFLVVLPETARRGAQAVARQLTEALSWSRGGTRSEVSVGIAEWGAGKRDVDLLAEADRELRPR
jgi:diguanylate cyclase (GGDEF)-like protein